jgi:hypothetical protein
MLGRNLGERCPRGEDRTRHRTPNMQEFASDTSNILAKADANWESVKKAPVFDHGDEVDRAALYVRR